MNCIMLYKQPFQNQAIPMEPRKKKDFLNGVCLGNQEDVFFPIYFGVACGLAAFKMLEAQKKSKKMKMVLPMNGSLDVVHVIIKGASQLVGLLLWKAQRLVAGHACEEWVLEKQAMAEKVAKAEAEVAEMKRQRAEDAKANEKVVAMFSTQEQSWKSERRNLKQQLEAVLQDFQALQAHAQMTALDDRKNSCSECELKQQRIAELNAKVGEKDFMMMTSMEAVEAERRERNELQQKISATEALNEEFKQKLGKEEEERKAEFRRHKAAFVDFVSNQRQMKIELNQALRQLESVKKESEIILNEKNEAETVIQSLSLQIALLEKDSQDKEDVISDLLKQYHAEATEKNEIEKELKISKALRRQAELEADRWRREYEGKNQNTRKQRWRLKNYSVSRGDSRSDGYAELRRLQAEEIKNLHMKYGTQISFLQDKIKRYEEKLTELEHNILLHMNHQQKKPSLDILNVESSNSNVRDLVELKDSEDADFDIQQFRIQDFEKLVSMMDTDIHDMSKLAERNKLVGSERSTAAVMRHTQNDPEIPEHFEDWIQPEKHRHRAKLDQKNWQGLKATSSHINLEDEKVEHFHWYILNKVRDSKRLQSQVSILNRNLQQAKEENKVLESMLLERNQDLKSLKERLNLIENKSSLQKHTTDLQIIDDEAVHSELKAVKRKLRERETEHRAMLMKILEEAENELQDRDYKLAMVEAKLLQTQIQCRQERKAKEDLTSKIIKRKTLWKDTILDHSFDDLDFDPHGKSVFCASCLEECELSELISRAKNNMLKMENCHEKHLRDLITKAARASRAGCHLRTMKSMIKNAEAIERSAHPATYSAKNKDEENAECSCFHGLGNDFNAVSSLLETGEISSAECHNDQEGDKKINLKHHRELKALDIYQRDPETNECVVHTNILMPRSKGLLKGKTVHSCDCSKQRKGELLNDEEPERTVHKQVIKENVPSTKSVPKTTLSKENIAVRSSSITSSGSSAEGNKSSWDENVQALSATLNIEEVWQHLEELEKTSEAHDMGFTAMKGKHVQSGVENNPSCYSWKPISAVTLLKKQVKKYQSLTAKINDLCKRLHEKSSMPSVALQAETEEHTTAQEHFLEETFQLQNYLVAAGQKLNLLQPEISYNLSEMQNDSLPHAMANIGKSMEIAMAHLREIQKKLQAWIAKIIAELEGELAKNGIMHLLPSQGKKKIKSKIRRGKISYRTQRLDSRKLSA